MPKHLQTNSTDTEQPKAKPGKPVLRIWFLFFLLSLLIVLVTVRDDLRQNLSESSENAFRYVVFDTLGWSPRELFIWRLRLAGLLDSPLGQSWTQAVERAGEQPVVISDAQYRITDTFDVDDVEAHIYQLHLERGEQIMWRLARLDKAHNRLYASLERRKINEREWSTVTDLSPDGEVRSRFVLKTGDYRIVLQPELFARTDYSLAVATGGSLPFPVEGAKQRDIGSIFGDPRDGGARKHHGVDIFAKRGTPVTTVIDGVVRTGTGRRGGEYVWLSGSISGFGNARFYYAHLDSFAIKSGDKVKKGDILGYVGNTGNAITTPPHLHFGLYSGGPVDPEPFLKPRPVLPDP